jgi:hypothetical protein
MTSLAPRTYLEWRTNSADRAEDAAYAFGKDLIVHCRDEALSTLAPDMPEATRAVVQEAVDTALHNVMDMLEGFWPLPCGPQHSLEYVLQVRVRDASGTVVERQEISPCKLDLPIGYWKWARDREFR